MTCFDPLANVFDLLILLHLDSRKISMNTNRKWFLTLFSIRPLGVESKNDMGERKIEKCILWNRIVAALYATVARSKPLASMHMALPAAKAT